MMKFKEIQAYISDLAGMVALVWGLVLLSIKGPDMAYVIVIGTGLSAIVGVKLLGDRS